MNWLKTHVMHLFAGGGTFATVLLVTFKDSLREMWQEWHMEKRMAREARAAVSGKDTQITNAFIGLLKSDLESQARTRDDMAKAITQLAASMATVLETQKTLTKQIDDVQRDLLVVKGAVLGRIQ